MTDTEHEHAVDVFVEAVLRRLDTVPVEIGNKAEMSKAHARGLHAHVVSIPVSSLVPQEDLASAVFEVMRSMKIEFTPWEDAR